MFVIHCASLAFVSEKFQGRQEIHKHRKRNAGSQGTASVAVSGEPGDWEVFALSWPWQITRGWWHRGSAIHSQSCSCLHCSARGPFLCPLLHSPALRLARHCCVPGGHILLVS